MGLRRPRPERPSFVEEFRRRVPGYMLRHKMKAGITGWAQINGWRGQTSIEKRIEYDLYYIERWSLGFDLKILLLTFWSGFRSEEHTSELQSHSDLVCRLLLEKKKKKKTT